jgi:6-phosphogluconolactonase
MRNISKNQDELIKAMADFVVTRANEAIQDHGRFSIVLSGGSSPKKLHQLLTTDAYRNKIDWKNVYFFFGDERYVPADHPDSNYLMAKNTLFDPLHIAADHIFRMNTDLSPADAAIAYEKSIADYFAGKPQRFDLIILGLGDDAHTASLFPGTSVLHEKQAGVRSLYIEKVKMDRITLTAPLINEAHHIAFLTFGDSKADAVNHILKGEKNPTQYPAQLITPTHGELHWFMDESAASKI